MNRMHQPPRQLPPIFQHAEDPVKQQSRRVAITALVAFTIIISYITAAVVVAIVTQ